MAKRNRGGIRGRDTAISNGHKFWSTKNSESRSSSSYDGGGNIKHERHGLGAKHEHEGILGSITGGIVSFFIGKNSR